MNKQHPLYKEDLLNILSIKGIESFRNKTFLITGATGLLGVCMIDALMLFNEKQNANITIYAVGRDKDKAYTRLGDYFTNGNFHFIEQDVCQPLPKQIEVDYIIPLASNTHPMAYSQYPIETIEINVKGAEFALQKAVECKAEILYPSTVEIYGNAREDDVFTENYTGQLNLSNARSCYTESKRVCEALCQSFIAERAAIIKIVRLSRIFGPSMLMSDTKASSQFIQKAIAGEDIVLKSKGLQYFSYTYVADAVAAMLYVLLHGENGEAYNISCEKCNIRLRDFAEECARFFGKNVVFDIPNENELKGYSIATKAILDNSKLNNLGFYPVYDFKNAIRRTISILIQ